MEILKQTSEQMRSQNNRGTQYPLFVIQDKKEVVTHGDYCDFHKYSGEEGNEIEEKDVCEECESKACSDGFLETSPCVDCGVQYYLPVKEIWEFNLRAGVFFTEKACDEHIKQNDYHYSKNVRSYVIGAWRNEEMKAVMQSILEKTAEKEIPNEMQLPSCYK
jgi:hypothetical protein